MPWALVTRIRPDMCSGWTVYQCSAWLVTGEAAGGGLVLATYSDGDPFASAKFDRGIEEHLGRVCP
jgi:hypothetical protein